MPTFILIGKSTVESVPRRTDENIAQLLGARIKAIRQESGITQENLAWSCELDKGYMSQVENGKRLLSLPALFDVAEHLEVEPVDLLGFDLTNPRLLLLDAARRGDEKAVARALTKLGIG